MTAGGIKENVGIPAHTFSQGKTHFNYASKLVMELKKTHIVSLFSLRGSYYKLPLFKNLRRN